MKHIKNWFIWLRVQLARSKADTVIRQVIETFSIPTNEIEPGLWSVTSERRNTYRVSLFLWSIGDVIHLQAGCEMVIERELIPREVALLLLEDNERNESGHFRLVPSGEMRFVVLGCSVDRRHSSARELAVTGQSLMERMQQMVCKLYAMELIIGGSEQSGFARSFFERGSVAADYWSHRRFEEER